MRVRKMKRGGEEAFRPEAEEALRPESLSLRIYPDPILTKKARPFETPLPGNMADIAARMLDIMYEKEGVGLAGPQAGLLYRIIVYDLGHEKREPGVLINPEIVGTSGKVEQEEGCLSFPGVRANVLRSERLELRGLDCSGAKLAIKAEGLLSIMFQHEIDHLEGITFVQRLSPTERMAVKDALKELENLA